jgi:hypothetical protein
VAKHLGVVLAISSLALGGCSSAIFKPFDADQGSVSMDARQRTILSVQRSTPSGPQRIVCAEPSPDAIATIAASAAASGGLSELFGLPGSAQLATSFTSAEQAGLIGARNSTITLLRDGLYRACEAYMNGALGDFGYGLVLVNYGRVMVSLLTADGLAHPQMMPPVVIGSLTGSPTTQESGSGGAPAPDKNPPAAAQKLLPAAAQNPPAAAQNPPPAAQNPPAAAQNAPTPGQNPVAAADVGAHNAMPGGAAPTPATAGQLNDQAERIFENVVLPLANPTADPAGKFIEITVACMLWLDNTGLKRAKSNSEASLEKFCGAIADRAPRFAELAIQSALTNQGTRAGPAHYEDVTE